MNELEVLKGGVDSKVGLRANKINQRTDDEIQADLQKLNQYIKEIQGGDLNFSAKMDNLLKMNGLVIPELFRELTSAMPNLDKSNIASKVIGAVKDTGQILIKKREIESTEEINPNSPKFQLVFGWIIELFNMILEKQDLKPIQINNIFNDLSLELVGWEDKVLRRLKGLSSKALDKIENPLIDKLKNKKQTEGFEL